MVRFVPRVHAQVPFQSPVLSERRSAVRTDERPFSRVDPRVFLHVAGVQKRRSTKCTLVASLCRTAHRLRFLLRYDRFSRPCRPARQHTLAFSCRQVAQSVLPQAFAAGERLPAKVTRLTRTRSLRVAVLHVQLQITCVGEAAVA